ncbi:MAG TPA: glycosyltransferase, partial [Acidimicrobiales bacterium]|nr:glycosyltransferase [Acidimicrobiales bacterium]
DVVSGGDGASGRPRVVALVAAKDRADTVAATVTALRHLPDVDEVLVVDDGSTDATTSAAIQAGAWVLRLPENVGKGGAVQAGVGTSSETDVYLLVDADVGVSAGAAGDLLEPVLSGRADLVIGVLPGAGGKGGFGLVKRLARAGIRRTCGYEAQAPLSGQRAVRGDLLRRFDLAPRFGLEVGVTIDAVRDGARVLEVPVDIDHRHTGRRLDGFVHRGRQGADISRALWTRLTSARTRMAVVVGLLVLALGAMAWSGSRWEPDSVAPSAGATKVLLVGIPGLAWADVGNGTMPNLDRLVGTGALAAMSVRTGSAHPAVAEGYATLGAGARLKVDNSSASAVDHDPGGAVDPPSTGGPIVVATAAELRRSAGRHLPTGAGDLGQALHASGRRTAVVGAADLPVEIRWPTLPQARPARFRPAALALMDRDGEVDTGVVDPARLVLADPAAPFRERADPDLVVAATRQALADADVVLVDTGDMTRVAALAEVQQEIFADLARDFAVEDTDAILGRLVADLPPATLVLVVSVVPPDEEWRLTPMVAAGAGVVPGQLFSPSTKRRGLVTLTDLAPTVLAAVGAPVPAEMTGHPLRYTPGEPNVARLARLDRDAVYRERIYFSVAFGFVAAQALVYGVALVVLARRRKAAGLGPLSGLEPMSGQKPPAAGQPASDHEGDQGTVGQARHGLGNQGGDLSSRRWRGRRHGPRPPATGPSTTGASLTAAWSRFRPRGVGLGGRPDTAGGRWRWPAAETLIRLGVLAFAAFPLASFLLRAVPFAPGLGYAGICVLIAIDLAIVALAARARRHPLSPLAWIMAVTVAVLVVDVATGARLQSASILGYSPHTAGRFYGLGNSAFAILAGTTILLAALHLEHAPRRREALVTVAALFVLALVTDGAPSLGDDVGGILTLGPVFALTLVALAGRRITWRTVAAAIGFTMVALGVAAGLELLRPPEARTHLGRLVVDTLEGHGGLSDTIARKAEANLRALQGSLWALVVPVVAAFILGLLVWQLRVDDLLPPHTPRRIGAVAAVAAGILGCVVNDSGIVVTAVVLVFVAPFLTLLALDQRRRLAGPPARPLLLEPALDVDLGPAQPTETR